MTTTAATKPAGQQITDEVASWPGVTAGTGRRGEFGFRVGRRAIGHLHGDRSAHFSFPKEIWRDLFAQGRVVHHPVFPGKEGLVMNVFEPFSRYSSPSRRAVEAICPNASDPELGSVIAHAPILSIVGRSSAQLGRRVIR